MKIMIHIFAEAEQIWEIRDRLFLFFITAIWLPQGQLWAIIEEAASLVLDVINLLYYEY